MCVLNTLYSCIHTGILEITTFLNQRDFRKKTVLNLGVFLMCNHFGESMIQLGNIQPTTYTLCVNTVLEHTVCILFSHDDYQK